MYRVRDSGGWTARRAVTAAAVACVRRRAATCGGGGRALEMNSPPQSKMISSCSLASAQVYALEALALVYEGARGVAATCCAAAATTSNRRSSILLTLLAAARKHETRFFGNLLCLSPLPVSGGVGVH